jgi:ubiquinone/menaquinone biosynthesis C-methylase UbiE
MLFAARFLRQDAPRWFVFLLESEPRNASRRYPGSVLGTRADRLQRNSSREPVSTPAIGPQRRWIGGSRSTVARSLPTLAVLLLAGALSLAIAETAPAPEPPDNGQLTNRDPHGPDDVEEHIRWLESSARDSFQKPDEVIRALRLDRTDTIADLGCGPGYFTRPLARAVDRGIVYAVDVEPRQLYRLHEHLAADQLANVVPVLSSLSDPHLPPRRMDVILVVDTYHHFDDRPRYLRTLARTLKPGGRLVIIDYYKRKLPVGPPVDHKVARETVLREVLAAGYELLEEPTVLPYQYFLVFGLPAEGTEAPTRPPKPG